MNVLLKLWKADPERKTRFHDLRGNFIGVPQLFRLPLWVLGWARAKLGSYSVLPWIPPAAARQLAAIAQPDWTVLECGSGMSSLWWAGRVKRVISLESNPAWHQQVSQRLQAAGIRNVELHLTADYLPLLREHLPAANLVVIDGDQRDKCAEVVKAAPANGRWVYLDNTDFAAIQGEMKAAESILLRKDAGLTHEEYFHGMPPGQLAPTQSLLVQLGGKLNPGPVPQ